MPEYFVMVVSAFDLPDRWNQQSLIQEDTPMHLFVKELFRKFNELPENLTPDHY